MLSTHSAFPLRATFLLLGALISLIPGRAQAASDLKTEFIAPVNLPNGEAPAGTNMSIKVKVTNVGDVSSPAVRLSVYKYDHTCSSYPLTQPKLENSSATYKDIAALSPGASSEVITFIDANTSITTGAASMTNCYKTGIQTSSGGYYSDSNSLNHANTATVRYVPSTTSTSAPLAFTVSNLKVAPSTCGPGQHWVEATVNSTQVVRAAAIKVEGVTPAAQSTTDLRSGNNTVRANVTYPQSGSYNLKFIASSGTVQANQQLTANVPKCRGKLSVSAPIGGESVPAGSSYVIRWLSSNVPADDQITIRVYNGSTWSEVATNTPNDGSQQVTMPSGSATNAKVQMFARKVSATAYSRDFTLGTGGTGTASIAVTQPAGGESVTAGQNVFVRWTNTGNTGDQVKIRLFRGPEYLGELASFIANDGSEGVTIPATTPAMTNARINVISSTNTSAMSNPFTITSGNAPASSISVTAPAAGAQLSAGSRTTVTWNSSGNPGSTVKIRISLRGGAYTDLLTNVANDGSEQVTLPAIFNYSANTGSVVSTSNAKIEVASTTTAARGESGQFSIKVPSLSFRTHLYDRIKTNCSVCHPVATKSNGSAVVYGDTENNNMINPQKARAQNDPASSVNETISPVIPFSSAITATEMLARFKSVKAVSPDYNRAQGKLYVVPSNPESSGLHWKAQDSTSSIFEENLTIENITLKIQDWITLWIKQGAAD